MQKKIQTESPKVQHVATTWSRNCVFQEEPRAPTNAPGPTVSCAASYSFVVVPGPSQETQCRNCGQLSLCPCVTQAQSPAICHSPCVTERQIAPPPPHHHQCGQQLHCESRCRSGLRVQTCAAVYQAEGRDKDVSVSTHSPPGNTTNHPEPNRKYHEPSRAHQEIPRTIHSPPGNTSKLQDSWRWRNLPLLKVSPSKLSPGNPLPPLYTWR